MAHWHMPLRLTRWQLQRSGTPLSVQRDLLTAIVLPQLATLRSVASCQYYASRQGQREVWLTLVADSDPEPAQIPALDTQFGKDLSTKCVSDTDPLLDQAAAEYRIGLQQTTDLALELLSVPDFQPHQRFLVVTMCQGHADPATLEAYAVAHSAMHRTLSSAQRAAFWRGFYTPGHKPELSFYGHWLWNIVVGPQPAPGQDPWALLAQLGAI
jgi:hypothetical protein